MNENFARVVPFDPGVDRLLKINFTAANHTLTDAVVSDTDLFSLYVSEQLDRAGARYGIGGYDEHRTVYNRSTVFDGISGTEPRRLHLGIDIWGKAGTPVFAPLEGEVHSFAFHQQYGDYGATIILTHEQEGNVFHSLYGHLALSSLEGLREGTHISKGQCIAHFGEPAENGYWPPHLHFQLIRNMQGNRGDYPGVCRFSERAAYLDNCPDPDLLLGMMQYV